VETSHNRKTAVLQDKAANTVVARRRARRRDLAAYGWIGPASVGMLVLIFIPGCIGVAMSFYDMGPAYLTDWFAAPYTALQNYTTAFDPTSPIGAGFWSSVLATLLYSIGSLIGIYFLGLGASLLLNRQFPGRTLVRAVMLIPWVLPTVAATYVWQLMWLREWGLVNHILLQLHIMNTAPYWLIGPNALIAAVVTNVWKGWPFAFIILLAGMQGISAELYDAAGVDGANALQRFWHITMPGLRPVTMVLVLLLFIWISLDFTTIFILFGPTPPPAVDVLSVHIYALAFQTWNFGVGSAISVMLLGAMMIICVFYARSQLRNNPQW